MAVDWVHFTPWSALAGGLIIGSAAGLWAWRAGRVFGISGLLGTVLDGLGLGGGRETARAGAVLAGLLVAPLLLRLFSTPARPEIDAGWIAVIAGGLLVGFGTRLGSGCTSGHGVCGLSRLSRRSMVATTIFMATAAVTVFVVRHVLR